MTCTTCDKEVPDGIISSCWEDRHIPDHRGLCCDCFDVSCGMRPKVVLGLRTASRLDEDDIVFHYLR